MPLDSQIAPDTVELRRRATFWFLPLAFLASSCGTKDCFCDPAQPVIAIVTLQPDTISIHVGDSDTLHVTIKDVDGNFLSQTTAAWGSSDSTIVRVHGGIITGVRSGGPAVITVLSGAKSDSTTVYAVP